MKRQVSFEETAEAYRFALVDDESKAFEISKDTLEFNSKVFYETFFKGLDKAPDYKLIEPNTELEKTPKHVYSTVSSIFQSTCSKIDPTWFSEKPGDATEPESAPPAKTSGLKEGIQ